MSNRAPDIVSKLNAGIALQKASQVEAAEHVYREVLRVEPNNASAIHFLGMAIWQAGRADDGIGLVRRSIELAPRTASFHANLGVILVALGRHEEALRALHEAVKLQPDFAQAHCNIGICLETEGRLEEAERAFARAKELHPTNHEFKAHHIRLLAKLRRPPDLNAIVVSDQTKAFPTALDELSFAYEKKGLLKDAVEARVKRLALEDSPHARSALVRLRLFQADVTAEELFVQHVECAKLHETQFAGRACISARPCRGTSERLRIGYVSAHFRNHPVARFIEPAVARHDRSQFEVVCYSDTQRTDQITARFRARADRWRETRALSDEALCRSIMEDEIDVLVDLAGHMMPGRLLAFARRPAPVQLSYLYPHSPGLAGFDGRITDEWADPKGTERYSVEKLLRLPRSAWCYRPPEEGPPISGLPALATGRITFGSLNQCLKITEATVRCWAAILRRVPNSRLLLLVELGPAGDRLRSAFKLHGVRAERVEFVERLPHRQFLELSRRIDIILDTFPFNGHTTSYDMLWMGLPIVTLAGVTPASRVGLSLLNSLQLPELVAQSEEDYASIATQLASDVSKLTKLRNSLRQLMRDSALMDESGFVRSLEETILRLWREKCRNAV